MTDIATIKEQPGSLLAAITRAVAEPGTGFNIETVERMYALHRQEVAWQAEREFNDALAAAQAEIKPVVRNKYNEQTRSRYADLEAVAKAIDEVTHRHGISLSFGTDVSPVEGHYRVTCKVARGGHSETRFADVPSDGVGMKGTANKTATHAFGSTVSYARRYLKLMIFDVATSDDDGNAASKSREYVSAEQVAQLEKLAAEVGANVERFCAAGKVASLDMILADDFDAAVRMLETKRGKGGQ